MKNKPIFRFDLTYQEYNYVTQSLRNNVRWLREGSQLGNIQYLIRFTEKTLKRLERCHEKQLRAHVGEKEWRKRRSETNKLIRAATKGQERP